MVTRLEKAFAEAQQLSPEDQEALASWILELIEDERKWDAAFARSQDVLAALTDEALAEYLAGETEPLDPDEL